MSMSRKRLIQMYQEIIVKERQVELPQDSLTLTYKYCTYEGRRHLRINGSKCQYNLDHFIMFKLEKYYKKRGQKKFKSEYDLFYRIQEYFDYQIVGPLFIRDLRLSIPPTSTVRCQNGTERYNNYNRREDIQLKYKLDYDMTISYLAFLVLSFVKKYDPLRNINQHLSFREEIVNLLLEENSLAMNIQAKYDLLSYFDFDFKDHAATHFKKNMLNHKIYNQTSLFDAQYWHSLIFNPTVFTNQIFSLRQRREFILKGMSGVGKSCSLILLVQLCRLVTNFLYKDAAKFNFLVQNQREYENTPKYIYISLSQCYEVQDYRGLIESQIPPQLARQLSGQNLLSFITSVIEAYRKKLITVIFVLDQIDLYFSCIEKCDQIEYKREKEKRAKKTKKENQIKIESKSELQNPQRQKSFSQIPYLSEYGAKQKDKIQKQENIKVKQDEHSSVFYSLKQRSYPQCCFDFVNQFFFFHKELSLSNANVLYSSFSTFEKIFQKVAQPKWFLYGNPYAHLNLKNCNYFEVNMSQRAPQVGLKELIDTIWFEMEMRLRIAKKYELLTILQQEKKVIIQSTPNHLLQIFKNLPLGLTNLRIFKYFTNWDFDIKRFSPQNTQLLEIRHKSKEILANFQIFLNDIVEIYLKQYMRDFIRFLDEDNPSFIFDKYYIFNQIKQQCQLKIDSKENIRFSHQKIYLKNWFETIIDQRHGSLQTHQMVLNYHPLFFIMIADNIHILYLVTNSNLRNLINENGSNYKIFGSLFDSCCTKMLIYLNISLTLGQKVYNVKSTYPNTFQYFQPSQDYLDIRHAFKNVFNVMEDCQQWIVAQPKVKLLSSRPYIPVASRCIDCLLIKKASNNHYLLRTIDFAMTFSNKLAQKIIKTEKFFTQFLSSAKQANLKFDVQHYIIVQRPQSRKIFEFQQESLIITVQSISQMNIDYSSQSLYDRRGQQCLAKLFECFMKSLPQVKRDQSNYSY